MEPAGAKRQTQSNRDAPLPRHACVNALIPQGWLRVAHGLVDAGPAPPGQAPRITTPDAVSA
jgi:hypothetical protein